MSQPDPNLGKLRDLVAELARVELPTEGLTEPAQIAVALDDLDHAGLWRLVMSLARLVAKARRLVGEPRRHHTNVRM